MLKAMFKNTLKIPLDSGIADQQMDINLEGKALTLRVTWNSTAAYWYMSLFMRDGAVLLSNIKLVSNTSLLSRYALPSLKGDFILLDKNSSLERPNFLSLGETHLLLYLPPGDNSVKNYFAQYYSANRKTEPRNIELRAG